MGPAKLNSRERMIGWGGPGTRLLVALINKGQRNSEYNRALINIGGLWCKEKETALARAASLL